MSGTSPSPAGRSDQPPPLARGLGFAGLIPQICVLLVLLAGDPADKFSALALGYAYAALILSFLGGSWWGLAAQSRASLPSWTWCAAVTPTLLAIGSAVPWAIGVSWPGPSLFALGAALIFALPVDYRLAALGLCPPWWLGLRVPLSLGLGILTFAMGFFG